MHELSIAISLIETGSEQAARCHARRVNAIHINVGPLSGVVAEALRSAYEMAREDSALAEAELVIHRVPIVAFCPRCQMERQVESVQQLCCCECGCPTPEIRSGNELEVTAMEIIE